MNNLFAIIFVIKRMNPNGKVVCCCCYITSVVSDSVWPQRWQPTSLSHPWDSPGKNTGVGCHFLLQCMKVKSESEVAQSCPTLSDPMDCRLPGSSVHGIFQARVLEWGAIDFSGKSSIEEWKKKKKIMKKLDLANGIYVEIIFNKIWPNLSKFWLISKELKHPLVQN